MGCRMKYPRIVPREVADLRRKIAALSAELARIEGKTRINCPQIAAIADRDPDRAEALVRAHLDLSRRNMAMYAAPEGMAIEGVLARILVPGGTENVAVNTPIAVIAEEGEDAAATLRDRQRWLTRAARASSPARSTSPRQIFALRGE
mgnify:CR=1 FL=1